MAAFDPSGLSAYLNRPDLIGIWDSIARASSDELEPLLLQARIDELLQVTILPSSPQDAETRMREVSNVIAKRRNRQPFDSIRAGLERLGREEMRFNPSTLSFWGWYLPMLSHESKERAKGVLDSIVSYVSVRAAISEEELHQRLSRFDLSQAAVDAIADELRAKGIRVLSPIRADVARLVDAATAPNIVALLQPEAWAKAQDPKYSAYSASIAGRNQPVRLADAEHAITFYDARNDQRNKDAVVKLASYATTDEELRDLVLSHHLEKITSDTALPTEVAKGFTDGGLVPEEADLLQKIVPGGSTVQPGGARVDAEVDEREQRFYKEIEALLKQRKLRAAQAEHNRVVAVAGQPRESYAKHVSLMLLDETKRFEQALQKTNKLISARNFSGARDALGEAKAIAIDAKEPEQLRRKIEAGELKNRQSNADRQFYRPAQKALSNGDLAGVAALFKSAQEANAEETKLAREVAEAFSHQLRVAQASRQRLGQALENQNYWASTTALNELASADLSNPDLPNLKEQVQALGRNDNIVHGAMREHGFIRHGTDQLHRQAFMPKRAGVLAHFLLFVVALVIDISLADAFSTPMPFVVAGLIAWGGTWFISKLLSRSSGCASFIVMLVAGVLWAGLAFDGMWATVAACLILAANSRAINANRDTKKRVNEWNNLVGHLEGLLKSEGLGGPTVEVKSGTQIVRSFHVGDPDTGAQKVRAMVPPGGTLTVKDASGSTDYSIQPYWAQEVEED